MKCAAAAHFTFQPDFSAHQLHDLGGDGQTEASATVLSGGGTVRLGKSIEDDVLFFGRNADAGVLHGEVKMHGLGRLSFQGYDDDHFAMFSEFHGVADQVDEHLTQAM